MNKMQKLFEVYQIPNYDNYELHYNDNEQKVFSKKREKYLKNNLDNNGYYHVTLYNDKGIKIFGLHRIVYTCLKGEIPEWYEVNHINENKLDNRIENLNLMTRKENINWGTGIQRRAEKLLNRNDESKQVVGVNKNNYDIIEFPSIMEAERQDKRFHNAHISACCQHKCKSNGTKILTVNKYYWFYKDEFNQLLEKYQGNIEEIIKYKISKYG